MTRGRQQDARHGGTMAGPESTPEGPLPRGYTIDELAAAAGLPSRTVRHYQSEGLLPPPARRGRVGVYDDGHVERLRMIAQLQDRGLRLRAIRDALRQVAKGRMSLEAWLGAQADLRTPWSEESPLVLDEAGLRARLGEGARAGLIAALLRVGLLRRPGDPLRPRYLVPSPKLLDIALRLEAAGVDVDTAAGAAARIRKRVGRAADGLVRYFARRTGDGFARSGTATQVAEALGALRTLGAEAVSLLFVQEIERALRVAVEQGLIRPRGERRSRP